MRSNFLFGTMRLGRVHALVFSAAMIFALLVLFGLQAASPAHAASSTFTVTNTGDSNAGSLRQAILDVNATANDAAGPDTIAFNIPSSDSECDANKVCTISPSSDLPAITEAVTIDGYTQGDGTSGDPSDDATENTQPVGNDAVLKIELNGSNASNGLRILPAGSTSTVKGLIINRFRNPGVWLQAGATGNKVEGNYIGTDASGTADLGNQTGVRIDGSNNTVGGTEAGARNIISGNEIGVSIFDSGATGNQVMGNYIGTDASGAQALDNNLGVNINGASSNTVGGTGAGTRNIISGNSGDGVSMSLATNNQIMGNYIGTKANGTEALGNSGNGVLVERSASNNTIGGTTAGAGNIISGNSDDGVEVSYYRDPNNPEDNDLTPATGNSILSNSIYDNDALGIDLTTPPNDPAGVTANDKKDPDTGANNLQNYPVLTSATTDGTTTTITGTLNSRPRKTFTIQFFSSPAADADPSGFGEGKTFLGEIQVKTNRKGKRSFSTTFTPAQPVTAGEFVTATATDASGNTSEFSKALAVTQA